jgi:hypothetical protein
LNGIGGKTPVKTPTTNNPNSGVRVRRTLSCYVKHPNTGTGVGVKSLLETESASTLNVTSAADAGGPWELGFGYNPPPSATAAGPSLGSSFNPICEFSPYSSLSSNDLLRIGTGGPDRRFSASTVFFHDNPVDCGCPTCFQVKLSIFQVN